MDKYSIPQYIDEPMKILIWTLDVVIAFIVPVGIAIFFFNQPIIGALFSCVIVYGLKKIKGEQGHYFIFNVMYWYLPDTGVLKATPPSNVRELIG